APWPRPFRKRALSRRAQKASFSSSILLKEIQQPQVQAKQNLPRTFVLRRIQFLSNHAAIRLSFGKMRLSPAAPFREIVPFQNDPDTDTRGLRHENACPPWAP